MLRHPVAVIAERLAMAREVIGSETIDYSDTDVRSALLELTGGRGPDKCIDAVGMEATPRRRPRAALRPGQAGRPVRDRPAARPAPGHHLLPQRRHRLGHRRLRRVHRQVPGRLLDEPRLTLKTGQCHVQRYMRPLLERIQRGEIDPTRVITHRLTLAQAPHGYDIFKNQQDGCEKVVLRP